MNNLGLFNRKTATVKLDDNIIVEIHNKNEAQFYANQFLKHSYESTELLNKTKNPRVFFERYSFLIKETENLSQLEIFLKFKGRKPSDTLKYLQSQKEKETNLMIIRSWEDLNIKLNELKTNKAKLNNINNLYKEFNVYSNKMTNNNIDLVNSYYKTFINNI